jgi:archaemetzincin
VSDFGNLVEPERAMTKKRRIRFATWLIIILLSAVPITAAWVGAPPFSSGGINDEKQADTRFSVLREAERIQAIGPTDELAPPLRRAFEPGPDFEPIPEPGASDWLAEHLEFGQTFEQFVQQQPLRPNELRNRLYILPLGQLDGSDSPTLAELQECAEAYFLLDVRVLPPVELEGLQLTKRINPQTGRRQFLTGDLMELMRAELPPDAYSLMGITREDLYNREEWNFVFGFASISDRVGILSLARNDPTFYGAEPAAGDLLLRKRRGLRIFFHESGHLFGMLHCIHFSCAMNGTNHLKENDARPLHLCPVCLRKLHSSRGDAEFVPERYERLEQAYRKVGLHDEAQWTARRHAWISGDRAIAN